MAESRNGRKIRCPMEIPLMDDFHQQQYGELDVVLCRNPNVSRSVVQRFQKLENELRKLGVEIRPSYTLSPPLGGVTGQLYNQSKNTSASGEG
jgi:hypothetical protein